MNLEEEDKYFGTLVLCNGNTVKITLVEASCLVGFLKEVAARDEILDQDIRPYIRRLATKFSNIIDVKPTGAYATMISYDGNARGFNMGEMAALFASVESIIELPGIDEPAKAFVKSACAKLHALKDD